MGFRVDNSNLSPRGLATLCNLDRIRNEHPLLRGPQGNYGYGTGDRYTSKGGGYQNSGLNLVSGILDLMCKAGPSIASLFGGLFYTGDGLTARGGAAQFAVGAATGGPRGVGLNAAYNQYLQNAWQGAAGAATVRTPQDPEQQALAARTYPVIINPLLSTLDKEQLEAQLNIIFAELPPGSFSVVDDGQGDLKVVFANPQLKAFFEDLLKHPSKTNNQDKLSTEKKTAWNQLRLSLGIPTTPPVTAAAPAPS